MNGSAREFSLVLGRSNLHASPSSTSASTTQWDLTRHHGSDEVINKMKTDGSVGNLSRNQGAMDGKSSWEGRLVYGKIKEQGTLLNLFFAFCYRNFAMCFCFP